jgi:hypothetical protein
MASSGEGRAFYNSGTTGSMGNVFTIDWRSSCAIRSKSIADRAPSSGKQLGDVGGDASRFIARQ